MAEQLVQDEPDQAAAFGHSAVHRDLGGPAVDDAAVGEQGAQVRQRVDAPVASVISALGRLRAPGT
jgi:hypothetical protein